MMALSRSEWAPTLRDKAVEAVYNRLLDPDMNAWDRQAAAEAFADAVLAEIPMLTPHEARALWLASIFGTPDPTPPEIASAPEKIKVIEVEHA